MQVNGGNSGGALINMKGELVGVVSAGKMDCESVGFAIPIDIVRKTLAKELVPENLFGFTVGAEVGSLGRAEVERVRANTPAAKAGIANGDIITKIDTEPIDDALRYHLAWLERKPGDVVRVEWTRGRREMSANLTLETAPGRTPDNVSRPANGVVYRAYVGQWTNMPDFDALEPVDQGLLALPVSSPGDCYALTFDAYVNAPHDGLYTFYLSSDDGSRLFIGNRMVVDNDGLHDSGEKSGTIRLQRGLHKIRIEYFELIGNQMLHVLWEGPHIPKQQIPASAYFFNADAQ